MGYFIDPHSDRFGRAGRVSRVRQRSWVLPCDGRSVSRFLYPVLFGEIGTTYGRGDGVATFNVPDL